VIFILTTYTKKITQFVGRFIKPELIKHFLIYSFGILIYGLAQFLLIPIFTRKFTPTDYGELELVNVAVTILLYITIFGLHQLILVEYYKLNKEEKKIFFNDISLILILIITPVYAIIFACYFVLKFNKMIEDSSHLFLFAMSYLLASRNLILVLYISTLGFAGYYIIGRKKYLEGGTLILGLFLSVFLILKFFPKTLNRYKELMFTEFSYQSMGKESHYNMEVTKDQWNGANFRMAAWRCGWELFLSNPIKGVDIGIRKTL
jgi:hypothetical protein